jgi:hypothetical protein
MAPRRERYPLHTRASGFFYGVNEESNVRLNHVVLSTGADFFSFFTGFGDLVTNKKVTDSPAKGLLRVSRRPPRQAG